MRLWMQRKIRLAYVCVAVALAFGAGLATAVGLTVTAGPAENGGGSQHPGVWLPYWEQFGAVDNLTIPAAPPALISTTDATPTVLPSANTAYRLDAATAGHTALVWVFNETDNGFNANRELMLTFTISTGAGPAITSITAYIETQAAGPGSAWKFTFYWDSGSAGAIALNSEEEVSELCSGGAGTC
jgi:hypothetical protein